MAVEKKDEPEKWVRGLLCDIQDDEYQCALVDYGEMQSSQSVRKLPDKYQDIPILSCICRTDVDALKKLIMVFLITFLINFIVDYIGRFIGERRFTLQDGKTKIN